MPPFLYNFPEMYCFAQRAACHATYAVDGPTPCAGRSRSGRIIDESKSSSRLIFLGTAKNVAGRIGFWDLVETPWRRSVRLTARRRMMTGGGRIMGRRVMMTGGRS